jgi:thioredoxin-like negative regulator of GroEL
LFPAALDELTSHDRPQDKATAPLLEVASPDRYTVLGYTVADYLLQRLTPQRRSTPLPALTWHVLTEHPHTPDDLARLAANAAGRLLYAQALPLYQRLADAGDSSAAKRLPDLLTAQGRVYEAIEILRALADAGDSSAAKRLADLLIEQRRVDEAIEILRALADAGDSSVAGRLAMLLVQGREEVREILWALARRDGRSVFDAHGIPPEDIQAAHRSDGLLFELRHMDKWTEHLRALADAGDRGAAWELLDLLAEQGRVNEAIEFLRARADTDDPLAALQLANLLAEQGRTNEAIEGLRARADFGDQDAAKRLAGLLAKQGRTDELRARADFGDQYAAAQLTRLLAKRGRTDELRAEVHAGTPGAAEWWIEVLAEQGKGKLAKQIRQKGLDPHDPQKGTNFLR